MNPQLWENVDLTTGESIGPTGENSPVVTMLQNTLDARMKAENLKLVERRDNGSLTTL